MELVVEPLPHNGFYIFSSIKIWLNPRGNESLNAFMLTDGNDKTKFQNNIIANYGTLISNGMFNKKMHSTITNMVMTPSVISRCSVVI